MPGNLGSGRKDDCSKMRFFQQLWLPSFFVDGGFYEILDFLEFKKKVVLGNLGSGRKDDCSKMPFFQLHFLLEKKVTFIFLPERRKAFCAKSHRKKWVLEIELQTFTTPSARYSCFLRGKTKLK